ncbi:LysR family transcriptional regulator [Streptomyces sp. NPDC048595]|uniref:LysR family transcriptional regulator n=1 Tax=Streptomyces sp. NPDC048595 TaxID=3365576 RepID=UPI0037237B60
MKIELRHARIVATIDAVGSISRGASELNLPQSSLTAQLRRIEKAVGGDLFVRSRSGVTPTALGERLIPMLADLVRRANEVIAAAAVPTAGPMRVGNTEWTPPTLRGALRSSLPAMEIQTETLNPAAALEAVERGALTAALVPGMPALAPADPAEPALNQQLIVREPVWLAVPRLHPLAGRESVDASALAELRWVRYSKDHWFHTVEKQLFTRLDDAELEVLHHVDSHREAMSWVRDMGVAALTTPAGATRDVRLVPVSGTESVEMLLVWRSGAVSAETVHKLVDTVRRYYWAYSGTVPRYWDWIAAHPRDFRELEPYMALPVSS